MIELNDLKESYDTLVKQNMRPLESTRIRLRNISTFLLIVTAGIIAGAIYIFNLYDTPVRILCILGPILLLVLLWGPWCKSYFDYVAKFKNGVVVEVLKLIDSDWEYEPKKSVSMEHYVGSELIRHFFEKYEGEDLITGKIGDVDFEYSELETSYMAKDRGKDSTRTKQSVFCGLFIHAELGKQAAKGKVFVVPSNIQKDLVKANSPLQDYNDTSGTLKEGQLMQAVNDAEEKCLNTKGSERTQALTEYKNAEKALKDSLKKTSPDVDDDDESEEPKFKEDPSGKYTTYGEIVEFSDELFKKHFGVYSSDPTEAKRLLSSKLIEALNELDQAVHGNVYLSLIGNRIYLAINGRQNLFEPNIYSSGLKFSDLQKFCTVFNSFSTIIKGLN